MKRSIRCYGICMAVFILCLAQPGFTAQEAALKLSPLPTDFINMKIDPQNPNILPYYGYFEQIVDLGGIKRTFKMYIPQGTEPNIPSVIIIPQSKTNSAGFLEKSGWKKIADQYKVMLFVAESSQPWKTMADDGKYLNAVFAATGKRTYFLSYPPNYYLVAYGDAASLAQQWAMEKPSRWAGLATFGPIKVADPYMTDAGNKVSDLPYITMKEVPLPVWCFTPGLTADAKKVVDYWRRANNSEDTYYTNKYANYVYMPSRVYRSSQINDENIAKVLVTVKKNVSGYDQKLNEVVWTSFLDTVRRYVGMANGDLRAYTDPEKMGYIKKNLVVDGWRREWYEYVPASIKAMGPNAAVPLVVAMHGRSGVGREYVGRSGWDKVAEDRGFIVVYPSSSVTLINKTAVPNTVWNINKDPKGVDDVKFIRMMVENIKTNHKIDSGRVYSSGQSMGGMMSYTNLLFLSDVFTAVGCTSGFIPDGPEFYKHPDINTKFDVPYWVMMGDKDAYLEGESSPLRNKMVKAQIEYLIDRYGTTALDQAGTYKSGPYNHRVWYNKTGVPMIRYTVIDNMPHATLPETCLIMWDDFLSKFYRDSDGKIVYEKGKINKY